MARETYFPEAFITKYKKLLGKEWDAFFTTIKTKQPKSFWINTNKTPVAETVASLKQKGAKIAPYSFHPQAYFIDMERPGELPESRMGKIAMQEKAAMLPALVLAPTKTDTVLDACAAPGMKTVQLSNFAEKVVACDVNETRFKSLQQTKFLFKLDNVQLERKDFRNVKGTFDKILLDAPCSSEGLVRKRREALEGWNKGVVERKQKLQKSLIIAAFDALKNGGVMVYSTCSFAPEENEDVVNFLVELRENAEILPVKIEGIKIRENKLCPGCARLYPQDNDTQQFFIAKIKKNVE